MDDKKLNREQKLAKLRTLVKAELNLCDSTRTPYICAIHSDMEQSGVLETNIVDMVQKYGLTIGQCISRLEREYNPNLIND